MNQLMQQILNGSDGLGLVVGLLAGMLIAAAALAWVSRRQKQLSAEESTRLREDNSRLEALLSQSVDLNSRLEEMQNTLQETQQQRAALEATLNSGEKQLQQMGLQLNQKEEKLEQHQARELQSINQLNTKVKDLTAEREVLKTRLEDQETATLEKFATLEQARAQMTEQFKLLANEIMEEKSKKFADQNQTNLQALLGPFKERIQEFQKLVTDNYTQESKDRSALTQEIKQLKELNVQIGAEAHQLAAALKGESKTRGDWGEMVLEKVLEVSGLAKGREYEVQAHRKDESGKRYHPDVIVHLPEGKNIIIDAKLALVNYQDYCAAETEAKQKSAMKAHVAALRTHVNELSEKRYQMLEEVNSLDFVFMFVPVEAAFVEAAREDPQIYSYAFDKNVVIVSASTLLAALRTVANLWRLEQQHHNARKIARRASGLYDKFVGFADDLVALGKRIDQTRESYDDAIKKLSHGRGNLVRQAEQLKELGVPSAKKMPAKLLESDSD